jgi:hypothetical protein
MTKDKRQFIKANDLVKLYFMHREKVSYADIEKELGIKTTVISSCMKTLKKYWSTKADQGKRSKQYVKAVEMIKVRLMSEARTKKAEAAKTTPQPVEETQDRFDKLESAFSAFQGSLQSYVEEEVKIQNEAILAENKKLQTTNRDLIEQNGILERQVQGLQDELDESNKVVEAAKSENITGFLRKKFSRSNGHEMNGHAQG